MLKTLIITLTFITIGNISFAEESQGQVLHQSNCVECHSRMTGGDGTVIYKRDDRIARTYKELDSRVTHCAKGANTGWSKPEVDVVTQYLNEQYYQF